MLWVGHHFMLGLPTHFNNNRNIAMKNKYLSSPKYSEFIALSRYARWLPEETRRESWRETVERYVQFFTDRGQLDKETGELVFNAIHDMQVMPSMRTLMTAGIAAERDNMAIFNCAYVAVDNTKTFDEILYVLACGTGVGFSCERQHIAKLPSIPDTLYASESIIVVRDSKLGWAAGLRELISLLYSGLVPTWDVSKVRPSGAPLVKFGGRASGSGPLVELFEYVIDVFQKSAGRKLRSIEVHGIVCKIANIIVCGGVRRSALISLSNLSDLRMAKAKSGQWWENHPEFALANNSVAYTEKPDVEVFMKEWLYLIESKSGERGIYNRAAAKKKVKESGKRDPDHDFGVNPCLAYGEMISVVENNMVVKRPIGSLAGTEQQIVKPTGGHSLGKVWESGVKPVVRLVRRNRKDIRCTPDHRWFTTVNKSVEAKNLKGMRIAPAYVPAPIVYGDEFLTGYMIGAGTLTGDTLSIIMLSENFEIAAAYGFDPKRCVITDDKMFNDLMNTYGLPRLPLGERNLPHSLHNVNAIAGLFTANGSVTSSTIKFETIDRAQVHSVGKYLDSLKIVTRFSAHRNVIEDYSHCDTTNPESYILEIHDYDSLVLFAELIGFGTTAVQRELATLISNRSPKVSAVIDDGEQMVYDFTEPDEHWGIVNGLTCHNCAEIILRPQGLCNLSEVIARRDDTEATLMEKVRVAAILGTLQSTLTDFRYVRKEWSTNAEEERLLGVSITGIMDCPLLNQTNAATIELLVRMRKHAVETNAAYADILGINPSVAVTTVKPSGTVSSLTDTSSGIHPRFSPYYIRTVRADKKDPLYKTMVDAGFPIEDDVMNPKSTAVISFPMKCSEDSIFVDDRTAIQQLEHWLMFNNYWSEHTVSITVYVDDDEWLDVGAWVYRNFDKITGISFLPKMNHTYKQAPFQAITEDEYDAMVVSMPKDVDWSLLGVYETEDRTTGMQTLACTGNSCEIVTLGDVSET